MKKYVMFYSSEKTGNFHCYVLTRRGIINKLKRINPATWQNTLTIYNGIFGCGLEFFNLFELNEIFENYQHTLT